MTRSSALTRNPKGCHAPVKRVQEVSRQKGSNRHSIPRDCYDSKSTGSRLDLHLEHKRDQQSRMQESGDMFTADSNKLEFVVDVPHGADRAHHHIVIMRVPLLCVTVLCLVEHLPIRHVRFACVSEKSTKLSLSLSLPLCFPLSLSLSLSVSPDHSLTVSRSSGVHNPVLVREVAAHQPRQQTTVIHAQVARRGIQQLVASHIAKIGFVGVRGETAILFCVSVETTVQLPLNSPLH
jgi:hypothetical protein